jgi:hypothetical protein
LVIAFAIGAAGMPQEPADSMRVDLVVARELAAGQRVTMTLRIVNTGSRPLELHLQGRTVVFDLIVRRGTDVVWRRLENEAVHAILQLRTLAPGETLELTDTWDQKDRAGRVVAPGDYAVEGEVPTDGKPLRAGPVVFRIVG